MPAGVNITVNWSHNQGGGTSGSTSFTTPSAGTLAVNNQNLNYSYPSSVTFGGSTYNLVSTSPLSGFNTGSGSTAITVTGTYGLACNAPSINTHPASTSADFSYGSDATFTVAASGTPTLNYQWQVTLLQRVCPFQDFSLRAGLRYFISHRYSPLSQQ
ncbi:hypothetical protein, partial [Botryobacter ruber]|uniref:hypothetical protein n=1 Tax=Botryobacter ruber TaxID=2171629 RepID=UPI00196AC62A